MSKLCANMFKISDFTSGGIFGFAVIVALLSFFVPHIMLIMAATVDSLSLGDWGYLYLIAFTGLNYLTFRHKGIALIGHVILMLLLAALGSGVSYLYIALFCIYLMPYICVYIEVIKYNKPGKSNAEKRNGY